MIWSFIGGLVVGEIVVLMMEAFMVVAKSGDRDYASKNEFRFSQKETSTRSEKPQ